MKRLTRIGWACGCLALLAPASARADSVSVMTSVYEASFLQLPAEQEHANDHSIFSWCRRCYAPDASPSLVSTNLSALSSGRDNGGLTVSFNGGFSASVGGTITFPVPAVTPAPAPGSSGSSGPSGPGSPSITLPSGGEGGGVNVNQGSSPAAAGGPAHGGNIGSTVDHKPGLVGGTVGSTGRAALSKAETLAATPEPATLFLLGTGLVCVAGRRARQAWLRRG